MAELEDRSEGEDRSSDVFQPDVLLPMQYFGALKRKKYHSGEHRLVVALMRDAVDCFQKYIHSVDAKRRQLYLDAEGWISDEDDRGQFSFNNVCELLGMNSQYVREGLIGWRDGQREQARKEAAKLRTMPIKQPAAAAAVGANEDGDAASEDLSEDFREQFRAAR